MEESPGISVSRSSKGLTEKQRCLFDDWIKPIKQSLLLESEHGFSNLLGRKETFHAFVSRALNHFPEIQASLLVQERLENLSKAFLKYPSISDSQRRHLVAKTRQYLYSLSSELQSLSSNTAPRLNIQNDPSTSITVNFKNYGSISLETPLPQIKNIGNKSSERLAAIGILTVKDLLEHFPRDYVDYSCLNSIRDLQIGNTSTIVATINKCNVFKSPKNANLSILEIYLQDNTGKIKATRFFAGRRFSSYKFLMSQKSLYPIGSKVAVSGLVKGGKYGMTFQDPLIEVMENTYSTIKSKSIGRLIPVYSLTEGITPDRFRSLIDTVLPLTSKLQDPLPEKLLVKLSMIKKPEAMKAIHRPLNQANLEEARQRLVFDEFLLLQIILLSRRSELRKKSSPILKHEFHQDGLVGKFLSLLPFPLTDAQERVLKEIQTDLMKSESMSRLLQGDVGSGKTVVAMASLLDAVQAGWQGALMAPTEVLATQHYQTLCKWFPQLHVTIDLLTGSTTRSRRKELLEQLSNGTLQILVGTHALIEEQVSFNRLGIVIVDEQHRFGVHQRNRLLSKGLQPHLLTMTATPIPRTLALSLYGDLDVSQIDELPPGRTPIQTTVLSSAQREKAYDLIRVEVDKGQKAYFVLPLVEESEKLDLRCAVEVHRQLSNETFPNYNVGLLHGRMSSNDKQLVINEFLLGDCQILVSTTVIEVGVDVPKATVMVIDHADRFGLSQLHQLRGRVGRGASHSYCVLINDSQNMIAKERLSVLKSSQDGFEISEIDLRLRGPGQVLGTRQSGIPDFALASLIKDEKLLELARITAKEILARDPDLSSHEVLKRVVRESKSKLIGKTNLN